MLLCSFPIMTAATTSLLNFLLDYGTPIDDIDAVLRCPGANPPYCLETLSVKS